MCLGLCLRGSEVLKLRFALASGPGRASVLQNPKCPCACSSGCFDLRATI